MTDIDFRNIVRHFTSPDVDLIIVLCPNVKACMKCIRDFERFINEVPAGLVSVLYHITTLSVTLDGGKRIKFVSTSDKPYRHKLLGYKNSIVVNLEGEIYDPYN